MPSICIATAWEFFSPFLFSGIVSVRLYGCYYLKQWILKSQGRSQAKVAHVNLKWVVLTASCVTWSDLIWYQISSGEPDIQWTEMRQADGARVSWNDLGLRSCLLVLRAVAQCHHHSVIALELGKHGRWWMRGIGNVVRTMYFCAQLTSVGTEVLLR